MNVNVKIIKVKGKSNLIVNVYCVCGRIVYSSIPKHYQLTMEIYSKSSYIFIQFQLPLPLHLTAPTIALEKMNSL